MTGCKGFEAYVRRAYSPENDMATSLSMGAAGGKVNDVSEWLSLATEQLGHRFIGGWLVNDTVGGQFYNAVKNKATGNRGLPWNTWTGLIGGAMARELYENGPTEGEVAVDGLRKQGADQP